MLADELALTPASLNHHLTRLVEAGILGFSNEGKGWREILFERRLAYQRHRIF